MELQNKVSVNNMMSTSEEIWRKHPMYDFELSTQGNIRTMDGMAKKYHINKGYRMTTINRRPYKVCNLVLETFKPNTVKDSYFIFADHINNDRGDDRLENLRWSNFRLNNFNRKTAKCYRQQVKGGRYNVKVSFMKKDKCLGTYDTEEEAKQVADKERNINFEVAQRTYEMLDDVLSMSTERD
jgi:hypothetical protein